MKTISTIKKLSKKKQKRNNKTQCPAKIIAFQYEQDGKFYADWIYEHNHPLTDSYYHNSRLRKDLTKELKIAIEQKHQ